MRYASMKKKVEARYTYVAHDCLHLTGLFPAIFSAVIVCLFLCLGDHLDGLVYHTSDVREWSILADLGQGVRMEAHALAIR